MLSSKTNLYDLTRAQLVARFVAWGFSPVHAARLWNYLYLALAESFAETAMPDLPPKVRARLAAEATLGVLPTALATDSSDGFTRKYLLTLADGQRIETVLMRFTGRVTACVSSQVGCAMGCVFCATGQMGYTRHLTPGEIVAQAVHVARALKLSAPSRIEAAESLAPRAESKTKRRDPSSPVLPRRPARQIGLSALSSQRSATSAALDPSDPPARLRNLVLMGMGEPLHNYDAVLHALAILRDEAGLALGGERLTLSTVGVVPGILRLAAEKPALHLAVSLHAATQEERAALVPVAKKWPLDELMAACRTYSAATGRRIFYEWTLIAGKNDSPDHARAVGRLLRGLPAQVNLIPLNPTTGYDGTPTRTDAAKSFQHILATEFALPSTVRQRRGLDIAAGCGQLAIAG
ncbi:MAG: hypothetical protein RLZZ15_236 [Verrucomicrobiota bacterium]|jgi:23S rRNA (adenine2503-C2)-methyltransferase